MKKLFYTCFFWVLSLSRISAQLLLSGTEYRQSFDSLAFGLPLAWSVDTNARAGTLGGSAPGVWIPGTGTRWSNASGSFKNVASANSFTYWAAASNAAQAAATDRALAVRQTASFGDPGAAFSFLVAHTYKLHDFGMEFRLQSLDSPNGSKLTRWELQYGVGISPDTFYSVPGSSLSTGGNMYSNHKYSFSFGKLLDDIREPVWVRLVSLSPSGGSGSRTMTALDDVRLYWSGTPHTGAHPFVKSVYPANGDRTVPVGSLLRIRFNKAISTGAGNIYVWNETEGTQQVIESKSANVHIGGDEMRIAGVCLKSGHIYHVTFDSSVAETGAWLCCPVEDTTEWRFQCVDPPMMPLAEYFDTACRGELMAPGWHQFDSLGEQRWLCERDASGNTVMRMYAYDGTKDVPNTDWLISPLVDLRAGSKDALRIHFRKSDTADALSVYLSTNYCGSGNPTSASWNWLGSLKGSGIPGSWESSVYRIPPSFLGSPFYIGFVYSSGYETSTEVLLDSISVLNIAGYKEALTDTADILRVVNPASGSNVQLFFNPPGYAEVSCRIYGLDGTLRYQSVEKLAPGCRTHMLNDVHLSSGVYYVEWTTPTSVQRCRFVVHN